MSKRVVMVLASLAFCGGNALSADFRAAPTMLIAQTTSGTAGPVASPGASMSRPRAFPSSSGAGVPERNLSQDDAYAAAIHDCESLPSSQRKACVDDINKKYGQM